MDLQHRATNRGFWGYLCIGLCAAVLVARSFLGFDWTDESFYLATAHRLLQGDRLIVAEWHPAQLFAVLTLPLMALYRWLNQGSLDGIALCFRLCYAALATAAGCLFFRRFARKFNKCFALMAALVLMTYVKSHKGTLSYNTMALLFYSGAASMLYAYRSNRRARYGLLAGMAYALATLCLPYLAVGFALAALTALLLWALPRTARGRRRAAARGALRFLGLMLLGIAPVLLAFLIYMLCAGSPGDVVRSLPYVFMDPAHMRMEQLGEALDSLRNIALDGRMSMVPLALIAGCLAVVRLRKGRVAPALRIALLAASALLTLANLFWIRGAFYAIPFALMGWICFLLCERRDMALFCSLDLGGLALGLTYLFSSNTGLTAVAIGLLPCLLAGVLHAGRLASELAAERRALRAGSPAAGLRGRLRGASRLCALALLVALCASIAGVSIYRRVVMIYRDAPIGQLTTRIADGPAEGLYTNPRRAANYGALLGLVREYATGEGNLIVMPFAPWLYLSTPMRCAAPTTWRMFDDDPRFGPYYRQHPDRLPDVMLALNPELTEYESRPDDGNVTGALFEFGGYLARYRDATPFKRITTDCADVYIREGYAASMAAGGG